MQLFSTDPDVPGIFAVGQVATGVFVLAQFGTGIFVIAQFGRGVFVLAQFAVGFVAVGQFAAGLLACGGMFAVGGRSFFGLPLVALLPRLRWPRVAPSDQPSESSLAAIVSGDVDEGLVRVRVSREDGRLVVRAAEARGRAPLDAEMDIAVMRALGDEADAGRHEALVDLIADTRRADDATGFRDAPAATRHLTVRAVHALRPPEWRTPFLAASKEHADETVSVGAGSARIAAWLGLCAGWWFAVGESLVAMFR